MGQASCVMLDSRGGHQKKVGPCRPQGQAPRPGWWACNLSTDARSLPLCGNPPQC